MQINTVGNFNFSYFMIYNNINFGCIEKINNNDMLIYCKRKYYDIQVEFTHLNIYKLKKLHKFTQKYSTFTSLQ